MTNEFITPYKRPTSLSDPHYDFTPGMLKELLEKNEEEYDWYDYSNLFVPHLPAGTYEEVMYFLPKAFTYLKSHEEDALDLVTAVFGFCSINLNYLEKDGLDNIVKQEIIDCLNYWTRDFRIVHYDQNACQDKGWRLSHNDLVINSEVICEGTSDLVRFESLAELAVQFVRSLAICEGNIVKASWFIEYSRARFDVYTPPDNSEIMNLLTNEKLLNEAYATVWPVAVDEKASPTYWKETFNKLGI